MSHYSTRTTCRVCLSPDLVEVMNFGPQVVSDFPPSREEAVSRPPVPIVADLCKNCTLVQARHSVPAADLYSYRYWYRSGTTETMRDALRDVTLSVERLGILSPGDVVLDIGANDGTLLRSYSSPGVVRVGVEPAQNLIDECAVGGNEVIHDFWTYEAYEKFWKEKRAGVLFFREPGTPKVKVVTALGMFYDLEDPNQFIADVAKVLHPGGIFVAQLMCLKQTLAQRDVGNFAHEHLEFYTLQSLATLLNRHGLRVFDVDQNTVNGGSYRVYACLRETGEWMENPRVGRAYLAERWMNLDDVGTYRQWMGTLDRNRNAVLDFLREEHGRGRRMWVYGASTKGNVILQYLGVDPGWFCGAVDKAPEKWGRFMVGTGIEIRSEDDAKRDGVDLYLVLPYAFLPEFVDRERDWIAGGGRMVVTTPELKVISREDVT